MAAPMNAYGAMTNTDEHAEKDGNASERASKSQKKINRKLVKCAKVLEKHAGITLCTYPTKNLVLSNCGLACGGTYETLRDILDAHGNVESIVLLPDKPYAFVVYSKVQHAVDAVAALTGTKPHFAAAPLYLGYVEDVPRAEPPATAAILPPGLELILDAVSEEEEASMLATFHVDNPQQSLKHRDVQHFGYEFQYELARVCKDPPLDRKIPLECLPFLDRLVGSGKLNELPDQLTVNRYQPGQGIAPHVDSHWSFEDGLVCLSLGASIVMDFRNPRTGAHVPLFLPARSALLLHEDSRFLWTHGKQKQEAPKELADAEAAELECSHVHQVYETIASHFSETRHKEWPRVAEFLDSIPEGSLLLDVGCGNGKYLVDHSHLLKVGLERSYGLASICRSRGIEVTVGDALALPWRDGCFDACLCIAVIHHLATEERRRHAASEMIRVLRPGSRGLVYVWSLEQERGGKNSNYVKTSRTKQAPADFRGSHGLPIHINRTPFVEPDVLVPWHNKSEDGTMSSEPVHRFYHVFVRGELRDLFESVQPGCVEDEYYDQGNWCAVLRKRATSRQ
ncbi:alkylated DNA repair protein alkB homolog 8-like isoform X2 [Ornithodoros turicata]|uniref:alkylated DNA repair protein alkB homolog 8-like isoform X2 n=1 Tax=Ornithodoros turicata TaxID=34597 RepID=UPI003139B532